MSRQTSFESEGLEFSQPLERPRRAAVRRPRRQSDSQSISRREMLQIGSQGLLGLSLSEYLMASAQAKVVGNRHLAAGGKAKACILLFSWGGMSHLETWDPKPEASAEVRGEHNAIATATPGVFLGEDMPLLAKQTNRMTLVRAVTHGATDHRKAAYWNLTGHRPLAPTKLDPIPPSRDDWPCLGSLISSQKPAPPGFPGTFTLPYPIHDRGLVNGQNGGFLGQRFDPLILRPPSKEIFKGVSPEVYAASLELLSGGVDRQRVTSRQELLARLNSLSGIPKNDRTYLSHEHFRQMAVDLLLNRKVQDAFDLKQESAKTHASYGSHLCGQSMLMARRLIEAGVPLITIFCSAGSLNAGNGDHWDTHRDNFPRIKKDLLPPLERASSALLDDLAERGLLDETLVVWMTEFGRTPIINKKAGRDHFPRCYSVALAGGGVRGGQVYGRSNRHAAEPVENPCGPNDLHATVFHALGLDPNVQIRDARGHVGPLTDGRPLPIFGA